MRAPDLRRIVFLCRPTGRGSLRHPRRSRERKSSTRREPTPPSSKGSRAPEQTFEETKYLKRLIENSTPVRVKMFDGEEVRGVIEYYDQRFIRLTREGAPNLFIFKQDIKYLSEEA